MSRWIDNYKSHKFHSNWKSFKDEVEKIDIDVISDKNTLIELSRIKKVTAYIDTYLSLVDPDLNSSNTQQILNDSNNNLNLAIQYLNNFKAQKIVENLQSINLYLNQLLSKIHALNTIVPEITEDNVTEILKKYSDFIEEALNKIDLETTISNTHEIEKLKSKLLDDTDEELSIKTSIDNFYSDIEIKYNKINEFYNKTLNEKEFDDTTIAFIKEAKRETIEAKDRAKEELQELTNKVDNFKEFYVKIFGELDEDENRKGGLKKEIEIQQKKLDEFEKEQQERYENMYSEKEKELNTLKDEIEKLLPSATSAGLASAYHEQRKRFIKPIAIWNIVFITSLAIMFYITYDTYKPLTLAKNIETISVKENNNSSSIKETASNSKESTFSIPIEFKTILFNILYKLPLYAPLIWLAIFANKRRSEAQRLEQEYAHKETLAKSYSSYKKQIEDSNIDDGTLIKKLLDNSIDTISKNASETLDKKHGDGLPSSEVMNQLKEIVEKGKDIVKPKTDKKES